MDNLKEAITKDIETLRAIEVGIMDSSTYYKKVKLWGLCWFLLLFLTTLLVGALTIPFTDSMFSAGQFAYKLKLYFGISFVGCALLSLGPVSWCGAVIVFKEQILPKLEAQNWLVNQVKRVALYGYLVFATLMFLATLYFGWPFVGVVMLFVFAISAGVMMNLVTIELNRVGASVLFGILRDYFQNTKIQTQKT